MPRIARGSQLKRVSLGGAWSLCCNSLPGTLRNMTPRRCGAAFLVPLCACVSTGVQPVDPDTVVAVKVLEDALAVAGRRDTVFLLHHFVAATAEAHDSSAWLESVLPERFRARVPPGLFYRYWRANRTSARLRAPGSISGRAVQRIKEVRETTIPPVGGVYSLSRVGFSARQDSALVEARFACRGLCGSDALYLYVKGASGWERRRLLFFTDH